MNQGTLLYSGKAKSIFATDDPDTLLMEFRDDTSAFDGRKMESLSKKGRVNNHFNAFILQKLEQAGIKTHLLSMVDDTKALVRHLDMIPV